MRITERRLRQVIRSIIKEELTEDFKLLDFFKRDGMKHNRFAELELNTDLLGGELPVYVHLIQKYIDNCEKKSLNCSFQDLIKDLSTIHDMSLLDQDPPKKRRIIKLMKFAFNDYIDKLYPHNKEHLVR